MDLKGLGYAIFRGSYDSFRGTSTLLYLDKEMNERKLSRLSPTRTNSSLRRKQLDSTDSTPVRTLKEHEESKVLKRTLQCCALNGGVFLLSIFLFEYGFMPSINFILQKIFGSESFMRKIIWSWMEPVLSFVFKTFWVVPLFLLSKVVNSLWFQDIADTAYRHSRGRPQFMQSLSKLLADSIFSIVVQTLFLIQAMLVNFIPIYMVGYIASLVHMCLLYSLYAFEYKWFNMGWELHKRLTYIETNWPYFIGFGLPLAFLTQLSNSWFIRCVCFLLLLLQRALIVRCIRPVSGGVKNISGCIFSILFPLFIISGNEASPVTGTCDYPLHLFSPVIALSNMMLNTTIGAMPKSAKTTVAVQTRR